MINAPENYNEYIKIKPTYEEYKEYRFKNGWINKLVTLNQDNDIHKLVEVRNANKNKYTDFIHFKHPEEPVISIGTSDEYTWKLIIYDEYGKEISDNTEIIISKTSTDTTRMTTTNYSDMKIGHVFKKWIEIHQSYHINMKIKPENNIPKENIKFQMTFDCWTK